MSQSDVGRYGIIPEWLLDSGVSSTAIQLFAVLAAKYADRDGECYPGRKRLAVDVGVRSERTVDAALAELTGVGAVWIEHRMGLAGVPLTNLYRLRFIAPPLAIDCPTPSNELPQVGQPVAHKPDPVNQIQLTNSISNEIEDATSKKRITGSFRVEMREAFPDLDEAAEYDRATNHVAYRKAIDKRRYYRQWLTRSQEFKTERRNQNGNGNGRRRSGAPDAEVHDRSAYGTDALRLRPNFVEG